MRNRDFLERIAGLFVDTQAIKAQRETVKHAEKSLKVVNDLLSDDARMNMNFLSTYCLLKKHELLELLEKASSLREVFEKIEMHCSYIGAWCGIHSVEYIDENIRKRITDCLVSLRHAKNTKRSMVMILVRAAFPEISEENFQKAVSNHSHVEIMVRNEKLATTFGI